MIRRLVMLFIIVTILYPANTMANGSPYNYRDPGTITGSISPIEETNIAVAKELININLVKKTNNNELYSDIDVEVYVKYELYNYSSKEITVPIAFPQDGESRDWTVVLNGQEIPLGKTYPIMLDVEYDANWVNPLNGSLVEAHSLEAWEIKGPIAQTFTASIISGENVLEIRYIVKAGVNERVGAKNPAYRFAYLLTPASNWKSFQDLTINLNIPFSHILYSSLDLKKIDDSKWIGEFEELPIKDLYLHFKIEDNKPNYQVFYYIFIVVLLGIIIAKVKKVI
ncbi:hypothetical protein [Desulfuribacillus alkaliarsenatis]|uniref:Uncharacterized protein n=1 Tax=Desulfuribacillus alkaliarsenatis TaxID=766136 RepID=A0A1E5G193_9FIRM|nr:hypothetical protein [Desulfuribacillus alkaliarsenatis]OEF96665.1 hypothetical protein BHF68_06185 [Desulfuribacillus alkaliarsenatis]